MTLRSITIPALVAMFFTLTGCGWSTSLWGGKETGLVTGSAQRVVPVVVPVALPDGESSGLSRDDLDLVTASVGQALGGGGGRVSLPWENAKTGAHGTVTPLTSQASSECSDFLLSHVDGDQERWMQGEACRSSGKWLVRSLKPWAARA